MPRFRTTRCLYPHRETEIIVFWFVQADEDQRRSTEAALNEIVDRIITLDPKIKRKEIHGVPWLRNYTPSMIDVFETARGFEMGEGHILGVDAQSLEDETLLVLHCVNEKEPEIGRANRDDAIGIHMRKQNHFRYTLAELLGQSSWTRIGSPLRDSEPVVAPIEDENTQFTLPSHIPEGTKLSEEGIVLFSLIKLTDEEITTLKQEMEDTTNEITIHNWPHDIPASQAETYDLFQCVKPELEGLCGQTFVMFIDSVHLCGSERAPVLVVATETDVDFLNDSGITKQDRMSYKYIHMRAEEAYYVKELWPLIWHPPSRGPHSNNQINGPLFYGGRRYFITDQPNPPLDWDHPVKCYQTHCIAKPGTPIHARGPDQPDFVVYILCSITPKELRKLRTLIPGYNGDSTQLLELNLVPRRSGDDIKDENGQELSSDVDAPLDPLMIFFDTPAYRSVAEPPVRFVFLDNSAIDRLLASSIQHASVPLAAQHYHYHGDFMVASDQPAYLYANFEADELMDALANLDTGNLFFAELTRADQSELGVAFWPEFKGSVTRDMLNLDC